MLQTILLLISLWLTPVSEEENRVEVVKFQALEQIMTSDSPEIQVINFWATWCKPCIKELPYFQALHNQHGDLLEVTLISLDFVDHLENKVIPFVRKKKLTPKVLLLDEIDYNSWIDKVDPSWTGSIPATLVIDSQSGRRKFVEGELTQEELTALIKDFLN